MRTDRRCFHLKSTAVLVLFSCLLLSLLVGIDCSNGPKKHSWFGWLRRLFRKSKLTDKDVKFYLFKRNDETGSKPYWINKRSKISSVFKNFSLNSKTKILIHGWNGLGISPFDQYLKKAYLYRYNYNIIVTDWNGAGAKKINYTAAALKVPQAAKEVGIFIERLCSEFYLDPKYLHVIGHSLGAHVASLSGQHLTIGKLGRVTGLDPARPGGFGYRRPQNRISTDSALFVDIIHSCGGFLGISHRIGHADFYPNKGRWPQPGCTGGDPQGSCSHKRAYKYYAESIRSRHGFMSTHCRSWSLYKAKKCHGTSKKVPMGEATPSWASGTYYLYTGSHLMFAKY